MERMKAIAMQLGVEVTYLKSDRSMDSREGRWAYMVAEVTEAAFVYGY